MSKAVESETDLEILHNGSDLMVTSLIRGVSDIEKAQRLIKAECQNKDRRFVKRKLISKIKELGANEQ